MKKIILASQSPRRESILKQVGLEFEICPSSYEEDMTLNLRPHELAEHLSVGKAESVANGHKDAIIISADTIVAVDDEVFGKPKTADRAKYMLQKLSGRQHAVITGFTIIDTATGKKTTKSIETKVYFKKLSDEEIKNYIDTGEPLELGGAYGIQDRAAIFIEKLEGDYFNIMGLPIFHVAEELKKFGVKIL